YYEFLLRDKVGTHMTPEECREALQTIYQQASEETDRLYKKNPGLDSEYYSAFPSDKGAEEILESHRQNTLIYFPKINPVSCNIKEFPDALSGSSGTASYVIPALDGGWDNTIYINSIRTGTEDLFGVLSHEGYPGHLYQTNYFYQNLYHPVQLYLRNEGYDEGWAAYAEIFNYDYLSFSNKDEDMTGQLQILYKDTALMELCISSLADLYVHYDGHSLEDLIRYLKTYDVSEEDAAAIYHHVIACPADSLRYSIGYNEFQELLSSGKVNPPAKEAYESLLRFGSCPFYILSSLIGYFGEK
ncbi:MAG: DUF885 family protein, partial [Eubacterium sp.]|nr:DUF885 family protein [Eubacterium sp.]